LTALRDSGQCAAAEKRGVPLIEAVRATKYRPLLAETLVVTALLGDYCGDPGVAVERAKEAYSAAVAGHHDVVAAEAASALPMLLVNRMGQTAAARDWMRIARAAIDRLGGNERIEGYLLSGEAEVVGAEHDLDKKVATARAALALTSKALGPDHPMTLSGLGNVGDSLAGAGRFPEALVADKQAIAAAERVVGPDHPMLGNFWSNECEVLNHLDRYAEALDACQRALSIWRGAGTDAAIRSFGLTGVGLALLGLGKPAESVPPLQEAVEAREAAHMAPALLGESRFALARALWSHPASRANALALARRARADSASDATKAANIDAWLAHPDSGPAAAPARTASQLPAR
jgi:tetratricopeptide (TPR) repeat protein